MPQTLRLSPDAFESCLAAYCVTTSSSSEACSALPPVVRYTSLYNLFTMSVHLSHSAPWQLVMEAEEYK